MRLYSHRDRPLHLSPLALERLARMEEKTAETVARSGSQPLDENQASANSIASVFPEYFTLFSGFLAGPVAPAKAPVPDDPLTRANNLKASAYFLDATIGGCCVLRPADAAPAGHTHAFVFLIEFGREPKDGEPGDVWIRGTNVARTDLRCAELAVILAGYVRWMGFNAQGHAPGAAQVNIEQLALRAGVARADPRSILEAPYLTRGFRLGVVTTDYALAPDLPLDPAAPLTPNDADIRDGAMGTRPLWWDAKQAERPLHLGRYPMEKIPRADEPSTLILRDEIARIPKRGDFFKRAQAGDLGERAKRERMRFPMKHPYALGMQPLIQHMVPLQGSREKMLPTGIGGDLSDPQRNADAIKALGHYLGADFTGICKLEPWMVYSHDEVEGKPIPVYHEYAVVMLIDQGFETMEGASGDDWISASQSMRAYMRGAEIAGLMAAHLRRMGYSARAHSNAHSEVIHNPCILMAGLGEVSRIGDTILNPFIGPRSKSVLFTTDLPMALDRPLDFNLQSFCESCRKCARECPCNAIPFGPKVMFNGYEIWKADVEKCTKYRVTNMKGSACGRCMKMCPWNREDIVEAEQWMWRAIQHPEQAQALADQDDFDGVGARNPVKRWWFDLEVVDGVAIHPVAGTNERDLDFGRMRLADKQKLAMFPAALQPKGGTTLDEVVMVDREAGLKLYEQAERPDAARARLKKIPNVAI
ncbi:MAG: reductive dehalogenase domain-containing protein [Burkholderiaceae bacterium]